MPQLAEQDGDDTPSNYTLDILKKFRDIQKQPNKFDFKDDEDSNFIDIWRKK